MARSGQSVVINISAGTSQLILDLEKGKAGLKDFGAAAQSTMHGTVSGTQAASGALRLLEGNFTNNIRAVERFAASTLGLGDVLTKIFPLVGAAASIGILAKLGEEAYQFFKTIQEAPQKAKQGFSDLDDSLKTSNDDLQVTNDKLQNAIAKLEGHRQNTLKLTLDEATAAADHLTDSLTKSISQAKKLVEENKVSVTRQIFGEEGTGDIDKLLLRFQNRIGEIKEKGLTGKALENALTPELEAQRAQLQKLQDQAVQHTQEARQRGLGPLLVSDADTRAQVLIGLTREKREEIRAVPEATDEAALKQRQADLEAAKVNRELDKPYRDTINKLKAEIAGIQEAAKAVGGDEQVQIAAKAFAAGTLAIEGINRAYDATVRSLGPVQQQKIRDLELTKATTEADKQFADQQIKVVLSTEARIAGLRGLTAAIGLGYEATKNAKVEAQLAQEIAADPALRARPDAQEQRRKGLAAQTDVENSDQIKNTVESLNLQIDTEKALAAAQIEGANSVEREALRYRLLEIAQKQGAKNVEELIALELKLFDARKENLNSARLAELNLETEAIKKLNSAQIDGAEAVRKATLENKYNALAKRLGDSPNADAVIAGERSRDELADQQQITSEAFKRVNVYKDQLGQIDQQIGKLHEIQQAGQGTLDITRALRDLEDERLHALAQQALALGTAKDGLRAFFLEAQTQAIKTSEIVYKALNSAVDRVSENLAKAFTGQKTNFGQAFKGIAEEYLQSSVKQQLQGVIGGIGNALGISTPMTAPKGTRSDPIWVQMATNAGLLGIGATAAGPGFGGSVSGGISGAIGGIANKIGGGAGGFIIKNLTGQNTPISAGQTGTGTVINNYIDARGATDPALTVLRVTQAIKAAQSDSVVKSVLATNELQFRTPR